METTRSSVPSRRGWPSTAVFVGVALSVAACGGSSSGEAPATEGPGGSSSASTSVVASESTVRDVVATNEATSTVATDETAPDRSEYDVAALLRRDPLVIFNAYPPKPEEITYELPPGQRDFDDLWVPGAPWQTALGHVDVYRLHAFQMRHFLSDEQLTTLIEFLREHEIPLMLETEPLLPVDPDECDHTESFEGPWDLEMAARLKALGGHVDMIAIEEPYHFAHLLDTPGACRYPLERVVDEVMIQVRALRELFGDIPVGTIEPIWDAPRTTPDDMAIWLDTFEDLTGESFAFLHVDPDWYRPDWAEVAAGIEAVADARDVPFGILYNGGIEADGGRWMQFMMENAAELEVGHGVTPQHVSFQSWVDWPDHALPEDDLSALTSGIVRYFGQRVDLSIEADGAGGAVVTLTDPDGAPVAGVPLTVGRIPLERGVSTQTVTGVVPGGVTEALVLVRANVEDAVPGDVGTTIREISYSESGGPDLVPNGDFAGGMAEWGAYGDPMGRVTPVAGGLELVATPEEQIFVDGTIFPVVAGAPFELSTTYDFDGVSPESVVVSVEFVGGERADLFVRHVASELAEVLTDADGRAAIPSELLGAGPVRLTVDFAGDLEHWPATSTADVG